jgi:hypothetical protein
MARSSIVALALAVLLGASPAAADTGILAVGDVGVGGTAQREVGLAISAFEERHEAALLVTLGDNDYTGSPERFRANWRESFGWTRAQGVRVAGTTGNHDREVGDGGRYQYRTLGMPGSWYSRRTGDVEVFLLDSNRVDDAQTAWLERALAASTARWKVAAFHHPPYTCGSHRGSGDVQEEWVPLFERHGVQLVLGGHDHNYQRFAQRRGVVYVVHGGGNSVLYPIERCPSSYPKRRAAVRGRGFLYVLAGDRSLTVSAVNLAGWVVDSVTIPL